jgi:hypothetical protein
MQHGQDRTRERTGETTLPMTRPDRSFGGINVSNERAILG